jgi:GST-like protein
MISLRDFPARWVEGEATQKAFREKTTEQLRTLWRQLESALEPAPYALGGKMSALDIYLAMVSRWAPGRKWLTEHCPKLTAAVMLTEQHPLVAKVWEKNFGK